jgi:hypothetical protein
MNDEKHMNKLTNEELIQHWHNCNTTYCCAGGHGKAFWNKVARNEIADVLNKRGIDTPLHEEGRGIFNGEGTN